MRTSLRKKISQEYSSLVQLLDDFKEYRSYETDISFEEFQEQKTTSLLELESNTSSSMKGSLKSASISKPLPQRKLAYFSNRHSKSNEIQVQVNLFYPTNVEIFDILSKKGANAKADTASAKI